MRSPGSATPMSTRSGPIAQSRASRGRQMTRCEAAFVDFLGRALTTPENERQLEELLLKATRSAAAARFRVPDTAPAPDAARAVRRDAGTARGAGQRRAAGGRSRAECAPQALRPVPGERGADRARRCCVWGLARLGGTGRPPRNPPPATKPAAREDRPSPRNRPRPALRLGAAVDDETGLPMEPVTASAAAAPPRSSPSPQRNPSSAPIVAAPRRGW